jgi:hypothetical protein
MQTFAAAAPSTEDLEAEIALFHQPAIDQARRMIVRAGVIYPLIPVVMFGTLAAVVGAKVFATPVFLGMFAIGMAIFGLHVALSRWAKSSPLAATSTALTLFIGWMIVVAWYDAPHLVISAVGLIFLGRGVLAGYRVHRLRKDHQLAAR